MARVLNKTDAQSAVRFAALLMLIGSVTLCSPATGKEKRAVEAPRHPDSVPAGAKSDPVWHDAQGLSIEGRGWSDTEGFFDRLPARAKGKVTQAVWDRSKYPAGIAVRFMSDARKITARWTVVKAELGMEHMPPSGVSGLDLYVKDGETWRWLGAGHPLTSPANECVLADDIPAGRHEYLLYLPLYNSVRSLEIGVAPEAELAKALPRPGSRGKPVCFYGTSITQGGCASRPGMTYAAILGRRLDWATINLGFSGSARMESEMADLLGEIEAAAYVLDCLPNMTTALVRERVGPFVEQLRKARPETPIILVESTIPQYAAFLPGPRAATKEKNDALREVYDRLVRDSVRGLTYVSSESLLGSDGEATVDGLHLTDLGFMRFSEVMGPVLRKVLTPRP